MTSEQLIVEGRKLERPCVFLRADGPGPVAAVWYERDDDEIQSTGQRCWLTVDSHHIPALPPAVSGYISVFTDEKECQGGRIEVSPSWPKRTGTQLYACPASVLPPVDAVFARGSNTVEEWINSYGWERHDRYNSNYGGKSTVDAYNKIHRQEYPLYFDSDIYAMLGGWHWPGQDDDWHDLLDEHLMVLTIRDYEPWVEAWRTRTGQFKVIQRIT